MEFIMTTITFIILGMFLGNLILIVLGLTPIIFLGLSLIFGQPRIEGVKRRGQNLKVWVDQKVEDGLRANITGGPGLVLMGDVLPKSFKLEEGTNFKAVWKGLANIDIEFQYQATCAKRGYFDLPTISWELRHPLGIAQNRLGESPAPRTFVVEPKPLLVKRVREHKAMSKIPMPMEARFKFGVPTTDFREIREYTPGDSYRFINWKASAKTLSKKPGNFLVNEYEKEGKKVVWLFLDSASRMALGTPVNNILEYAVRAALGFTHFYLGRDCRVGFVVYDHDAYQWEGPFQTEEKEEMYLEPLFEEIEQIEDIEEEDIQSMEPKKSNIKSRILFPDVGRRQQYKITREVLHVDVRYSNESLKEAVHSSRRHIVGTRPMFIIITMIEGEKVQGLIDGVKEMYRYAGKLRRHPTIIIFNVKGYNVAAQNDREEMAAKLLEYHNRPYLESLRKLGVIILNWDPEDESFAQALQRQR
jgi:uncharacterized protein (DUF58 family)